MIDEILNSYNLCLDYAKRLVPDLDDQQMATPSSSLPNHPAWTLGHLVYSAQMIGQEMGMGPWLGKGWGELFGTGPTPEEHTAVYPSKDELVEALADAQERLAARLHELGGSGLAGPLPDERYRDMFPTLGHTVLHILTVHAAIHVGQLSAWRRAMGLVPVPE